MDYSKKSLELHRKTRGKIEIKSKVSLKTKNDLSLAYTPGVAAVCMEIGRDRQLSYTLTNRASQVAIVSDGTAILGLGDLGPEAAMPVMEGKAIIFKEFADIDAIPLCINSTEVEDIVKFCKLIEPSFAGINLEDIAAPRCFEILERLERELSIPVFHDDQDGTAIITLAAIINACRLFDRKLNDLHVVINGAGAAGIAIAKLLIHAGLKEVVLVDTKGAIYSGRPEMNRIKQGIAEKTNRAKYQGDLKSSLIGADVFIGVSRGNILTEEMIKGMNDAPFIFAMANPEPEIMPDRAYKAGAAVVGTGRSDLPNQVNNALVFPGLFKGLLKSGITEVTPEIKMAVAFSIAHSIEPTRDSLMPTAFNKQVVTGIVDVLSGIQAKKATAE
ncbi:NAD(P)-dependent malic enzyme [Chlorobium phaeobacteroides]|jgi:malate dehydrogenase (oxaloacetate-decarboxylating)|uniref:Malate dehydrogenase (Oxaloacetate-decarboxylating) n=1 Tax=Chlorobium phaeobacteroides (strain DSM 266 / SMG 266 / 2430) TaxID=290317 RepID=A1BFX7_CHLPD|nr:NADP-dependent malic enzyme [Chlorobium phaeobacteroides]ABL65304.1 Malate dehydrogenase (oxaloacetate-decarboxylating) [Chlorobium phaeobacteroides DSM 266]MBV5327863.1 NADP-dependent malic enzyme [Chlorobium sp.]